MKRVLKWIAIVLAAVVLSAVAFFFYMRSANAARFAKKYDVTVRAVPIPFPLSDGEIAALRRSRERAAPPPSAPAGDAPEPAVAAGGAPEPTAPGAPANGTAGTVPANTNEGASTGDIQPASQPAQAPAADPLEGLDVKALAHQRAIARGKRYVETRAACSECHGEDFGGKVIIDSPVMGKWVAPNITRGGVTKDYEPKDWVAIIRHGLKKDRTPSNMPALDFTDFSDQEISDIAAYARSLPPVDRVMPPSEMGPVFTLLFFKGDIPISAEKIDHAAKRPVYPPPLRVSLDLGQHLANTCKGCHGPALNGGPIQGGDPSWPPARNLTFHKSGIEGWSLEDFTNAMRKGVRPDGAKIDPVMPIAYTSRLEDSEIGALYVYLKSLPPKKFAER